MTQSLVGGRRGFASYLLTQILGLFLLQEGKVVILRVFQDISLNKMKGKTVFSKSIRGEEFVPILQTRKLKLKLVRHIKFVGKCAFRPVV